MPHDGGQPTDSALTPGPEVVAVVAGRPITRAALDERVAAARRGPRGKHLPPDIDGAAGTVGRWIVQEAVTELVLEHEVAAAGLGELTPANVMALVERVTAHISVDEVDLHSYYARNDDLFRGPDGEGVVAFAEARDAIEAELLAEARARAFGEWLATRREALTVIDPAWAHPGDPVHGVPSHRH